MSDKFAGALDAYLTAHWGEMVEDIAALVAVPSVEDLAAAASGAPFGLEPERALEAALDIAARLGFAPCNMDGYVGYADLAATGEDGEGGEGTGAGAGADAGTGAGSGADAAAGEGNPSGAPLRQVGIIGHVDVVGAGPGWTFDPWTLTACDGYLVGRGVIDDKGPLVVAMHAARFAHAWGAAHPADALPFATRIIIGANEETGMADVEHYRAAHSDPDFLFTPDAEFPVGYGEKGIYHAELVSAPITGGGITELCGGSAVNAVPGEAHAVLSNSARVQAVGKTAHASTPHEGESAVEALIDSLTTEYADTLLPDETAFLTLCTHVTRGFDGAAAGLACADADLGALTVVGGVITLAHEGSATRIAQSIDIRYPLTTTAEHITAALTELAAPLGAELRVNRVEEPYLTSADSPEVQALMAAYRSVTGDAEHSAFTMGGGTYARKFSCAASFGVEMPWLTQPAWVGSMHAADEAVSEEHLRTAFKVYATALRNLAKL